MQTRIYRKKYINGSENSKGHKNNFKKQTRLLFWPRSIHLCHQEHNPARETVPLRHQIPSSTHIQKVTVRMNFNDHKEFHLMQKYMTSHREHMAATLTILSTLEGTGTAAAYYHFVYQVKIGRHLSKLSKVTWSCPG
jgi:hypothetical protein